MKFNRNVSLVFSLTVLFSSIAGYSAHADDLDPVTTLGVGTKIMLDKTIDLPANTSSLLLSAEKPTIVDGNSDVDNRFSSSDRKVGMCSIDYEASDSARFVSSRVMVLTHVDSRNGVDLYVTDKTIKSLHCVSSNYSIQSIKAVLADYISITPALPVEAELNFGPSKDNTQGL